MQRRYVALVSNIILRNSKPPVHTRILLAGGCGDRGQARALRAGGRGFDSERIEQEEGCWAGLGTDTATGQPILTCEWIDQLAPRVLAVIACGNGADRAALYRLPGAARTAFRALCVRFE